MDEPNVGTLVGGDFRLVRRLGAGGMGVVWVAEQLSTGIPRAIKLLRPELVGDELQLKRFLNEARMGAQIPSDHVVQVLGAGRDPGAGVPWLAMELLEGVSLGAHLRDQGRMHPADAWEVLLQLCHALGAGHSRGIVHRDVKPENVFLAMPRREGARFTVKVLDFGIAKLIAPGGQTTTAPMGSPVWMAPEQTEAHTNVSPAADVWALGLLMFRMLTGMQFWLAPQQPNASITALMREILLEPIPPASARGAALGCSEWLPPGFDGWFSMCVCRDVAARFPDAAHARQALDALMRQWGPVVQGPPGPFVFGDIPQHALGLPGANTGTVGQGVPPSGASVASAGHTSAALDQFGTSIPVYLGQTAALGPGNSASMRLSGTDWTSRRSSPSRVPLLLALMGAGGLFVLGAVGLIGWRVYGSAVGEGGFAAPGSPSDQYDIIGNMASVPAGSKEPGTQIGAFVYTEMSKSMGLDFAAGGDRCHALDLHGSGASLCSPAQWRYACRQNSKVAGTEAWVGSLQSETEALVCGGNGSCDSCRKVKVDTKSAKRSAPCCTSAVLIRNASTTRKTEPFESVALAMLHGNRYATDYPMDFPYFAPTVDWYDSRGLSAEAAKKLLRDQHAQYKDEWSVDEECTANSPPSGDIVVTQDCRRTVRTSKGISAVMTRLEFQRQSPANDMLVLRSARDTAVLFRMPR